MITMYIALAVVMTSSIVAGIEQRAIANTSCIILVNNPNPFNPARGSTNISYSLDNSSDVALLIYNISAELVYRSDFIAGTNGGNAGNNTVVWDGAVLNGGIAANGVYFCRILDKTSGRMVARGKIAVI